MSDLWGLHTAAEDDYRDSHQAPNAESGAPMHDVTQGIYPDSFYNEPFNYYGSDEGTGELDSWYAIHRVRGNPNAKVKIHRALPLDVAKRERGIGLSAPLNTGDWVTPSYDYAHEHGESRFGENTPWTVVTSTVPASQLHTNGDSLAEWGYNGPPTQSREGSTAEAKRKYRHQQMRKQQISAETAKDFHHCGFCGSPSGVPCERGCWGKKKYPGERDVRGELPDTPGVSGGGEIDYDPDALRDIRLSHRSTDGIRYAHLVEATVAEDLRRLAMPSQDAYDYAIMDSKRKTDDIPEQGEFYHGSNHEHQPGDILESVSARGDQDRMDYYRKSIGAPNHADWVWMYNHPAPATKYHKHVYQLEPLDEGPWMWNNIKRDDGQFRPTENDEDFPRLVSPRARVVRKLTPDEHAAASKHLDDFYEKYWADQRNARLAMPTYYHYTHDPNFTVDPGMHPWDHFAEQPKGSSYRPERATPGLYVTPNADDHWKDIDGIDGGRRHRVELEGPEVKSEGDDRGSFIPGDQLGQYTVKNVGLNQHWVDEYSPEAQKRKWEEYGKFRAKLAMPAPLPQGVHFRYHPELMWSPGVTAHLNGKQIGSLEWYDDDHIMCELGSRKPGEIDRISVHPDHQGNSVASSMFDFAKQHEPRLHHSDTLTEDGEGWSAYEKSRNARLAVITHDLTNRLQGEFGDWWGDRINQNDTSLGQKYPSTFEVEYPDTAINSWPHVEAFLKDRYPAAHRGLSLGFEHARDLLDHPEKEEDEHLKRYETGPEAEARHGYDPKEIAAGMLLLHQKTDDTRSDLWEEDQDRLNDIAQKRFTMQRDYEQRTARLAMAWQDWAPQIHNTAPTQPYGNRAYTECPPGGGCGHPEAHARYWIHHGDGNASSLSYRHSRDQFSGQPKLQVEVLKTHPDHRNDGVAEALIRRLHEDHPETPISTGSMSMDGYAFYNRMLEKEPDARGIITAGRNGEPPPMTFEPFNTMWSNGIMARHADDGRPIAHLHWYPDGEIETIRVHPQLQGRDIAKHVLAHAAMNPDTYEAEGGIKPSNHLTPAGRAFAQSLGHNPSDAEVTPAEGEDEWAWKAVDKYVPLHVPYNGQNEAEMSKYLEQPWTPPTKTASADDEGWPVWWRGRHRPAGPFDKRWHPNHPEHTPAPWDQ